MSKETKEKKLPLRLRPGYLEWKVKRKEWWRKHGGVLLFAIIGACLCLFFYFLPIVMYKYYDVWGIDIETPGAFGDFFNGLTAPAINIVVGVLLFISFREQRVANKQFKEIENTKLALEKLAELEENSVKLRRLYNDKIELILGVNADEKTKRLKELFYYLNNVTNGIEFISSLDCSRLINSKLSIIYFELYKDLVNKIRSKIKAVATFPEGAPNVLDNYRKVLEETIRLDKKFTEFDYNSAKI